MRRGHQPPCDKGSGLPHEALAPASTPHGEGGRCRPIPAQRPWSTWRGSRHEAPTGFRPVPRPLQKLVRQTHARPSGIDSPSVKVRDAASRLWSHGKRVSQYARKLLLTMKMASVDPDFAGTDAFYEMCGLDAETIARIQA